MPEKRNDAAGPADREIVIARVVSAPRELVWEALTRPEHVVHWWGPRGFTTETEVMDVRPGGVWKHTMIGPEGARYPNKSLFREVVPPERIVYSHGGAREGGPGANFVATWTFEAVGPRQTRVTIRMVFPSAEARDLVVREYGAIEGGEQTLARLDELLATWPANANPADAAGEIVTTRVFAAARELVWRAWTEPELLAQWWGPLGFRNAFQTFEPVPGGRWVFTMHGPDGAAYPNESHFVEVAAPGRIVFDHVSGHRFRVLATFEPEAGGTRVTFRMIFEDADHCREIRGFVTDANEQNFDRLGFVLANLGAGGTAPFVIARELAAPRALVYQAWTQREHLRRWWGPKGVTVTTCELDLRTGGTMHYGMRMADGRELWGRWVFRDIVPGERLVFVDTFSDPAGGVTRHPFAPQWPVELLTTVTFTERDGKTTVRIQWVPINADADERGAFDGARVSMQGGWTGTLDRLAEYFTPAAQ
jgi:uncharacterized protein YndB with AHSA1/START domain